MALDVEGVVDGSVCGKEFLGRTRALEPLHLALPPPRRLMRILSSIVLPSPALMPAFDPKLPGATRESYDARVSRTVLRERGGAIPPRHSPSSMIGAPRRSRSTRWSGSGFSSVAIPRSRWSDRAHE